MEINLNDEHKVRSIDANEKNKFKFVWLNKSVKIKLPAKGNNTNVEEIAVNVGDSIKKIDISGTVNCQLCTDTIYYEKRGFSAISSHLQTKKHLSKVQAKRENYTLPANFFGVSKSAAPCPAVPSALVQAVQLQFKCL
ncbi:hypothetical protein AVEN_172281-1 [Araneus ventricosus]|uniref:Uncharacterized protein n=1 Tax=Araneus ventricosus TaxID=182803 RepID=A0A4Y2QF90_ARAVE|nr:hypothetical protein AVEN_172281-1 [Araneus ventricosus]